jgi:hypothetical protein
MGPFSNGHTQNSQNKTEITQQDIALGVIEPSTQFKQEFNLTDM